MGRRHTCIFSYEERRQSKKKEHHSPTLSSNFSSRVASLVKMDKKGIRNKMEVK